MQVAPNAVPGDTLTSHIGYWLLQVTGILWVGVPMFFVISGYCIFATLEKSLSRGDTVGGVLFPAVSAHLSALLDRAGHLRGCDCDDRTGDCPGAFFKRLLYDHRADNVERLSMVR